MCRFGVVGNITAFQAEVTGSNPVACSRISRSIQIGQSGLTFNQVPEGVAGSNPVCDSNKTRNLMLYFLNEFQSSQIELNDCLNDEGI